MQAWDNFLHILEKELGKEVINKWVRSLKILHFDACNLYLEARDSFQTLWFEEHVRPIVEDKFYNNNFKKIKVHVNQLQVQARIKKRSKKDQEDSGKNSSFFYQQDIPFVSDEIDQNSRFETFVVNEKNLLAYRLLSTITKYDQAAASENPISLTTFNPIYLYGPSGGGKTHLLAAAHYEFEKLGMKVLYTQAKTFIENVVRALRSGQIQKFREIYRWVDVLLVDGVQSFSKKGATQEEFFHTFNTLHVQGKLIILTADVVPADLTSIEARLVSRFEWGITINVEPLEGNDLFQLAQAKSKSLGLGLEKNVCVFLCESFPSAKSLCQALEALVLRTHLQNQTGDRSWKVLDVLAVQMILKDLLEGQKRFVLTSDNILDSVAHHYGVPTNEILGKSQNRECTLPRQVSMYLCREMLKLSYAKIGELFSRNHSTVMSSIRQIQDKLKEQDPQFCSSILRIQKHVENLKNSEIP